MKSWYFAFFGLKVQRFEPEEFTGAVAKVRALEVVFGRRGICHA